VTIEDGPIIVIGYKDSERITWRNKKWDSR
jgi:hypothetical protein